ncbi:MAG: hydroxypyruvate isomerase family protein [Brachymonas sp.]
MPKFAANLSMMYAEMPFEQRFEAAAKDGFSAVEFQFAYQLTPQEIAQLLEAAKQSLILLNAPPAGTEPASIAAAIANGERGTAALLGREAEFRAGLGFALRYASTLACPRVHVMAGCMPQGMEREALQPTYIANLRWAAAQAAPLGITLLIEPLNQRDVPGYFLNRQDHAHEIVNEVGAPNLKVQMDLYHCQITEGDLAAKLKAYLPTGRVGHLQIAGVPERFEPDVGEINHPYLFDLIDALGYTEPIGCEYKPARGAVAGSTSAGLGWLKNRR